MRAPRIGTALWLGAAPLVLAHVAISLVVVFPRDGATVPSDSKLVVLAQRTLGGVGETAFTVQVDGYLLDPRTGRRAAAGEATAVIAVGERATIPLRDLAPGPHHAEINYRPDADERARAVTVEFEVDADGGSSADAGRPGVTAGVVGAGVLVVAGVVAAGAALARARARRASARAAGS